MFHVCGVPGGGQHGSLTPGAPYGDFHGETWFIFTLWEGDGRFGGLSEATVSSLLSSGRDLVIQRAENEPAASRVLFFTPVLCLLAKDPGWKELGGQGLSLLEICQIIFSEPYSGSASALKLSLTSL